MRLVVLHENEKAQKHVQNPGYTISGIYFSGFVYLRLILPWSVPGPFTVSIDTARDDLRMNHRWPWPVLPGITYLPGITSSRGMQFPDTGDLP